MRTEHSTAAKSVKRGLADHVYEELKTMLAESRFGRGGWVPVDEVAAELEVSRQPVMDAVKRLAIEGFLVVVPQVGCKVREYSSDEINEFYVMYAHCEAVVAELAARRATAEDVLKLRIISDQIENLGTLKLSKQDLSRLFRTLNRMLHTEIRRMAKSAPIAEIVESMGDRGYFFVATSGRPMLAETLEMAQSEHQEIIAAIEKRNGKACYEAMKKHVLCTNARLQEFLRDDAPKRAPRAGKESRSAHA